VTLVTSALVLSRRCYRESDRISILYSESLGKVSVRFIGVDRPRGKLKALSEPMVWGEYRLFLGRHLDSAKALGGRLISTFPNLRSQLPSTLRGIEFCELLDRLTPFRQPSLLKYELITKSLSIIDSGQDGPWIKSAFCLRLLEAAGFGVSQVRVSSGKMELWRILHQADLSKVIVLPDDRESRLRLEAYLLNTIERIIERPLQASRLTAELIRQSEEVLK